MTSGRDRLFLWGYVVFPLLVFTGGIIHQSQKVTFFALIFFLCAYFMKNPWLKGFMGYIGAWLLYLLVSYLFSMATNSTVNLSLMFCLYMILGAMVIYFTTECRASNDVIYDFICMGALLQVVIAITQLWGLDPIFKVYNWIVPVKHGMDDRTAVGTLGNNNFFAAYITMSLPFFFRRYWAYAVPVLLAMLWVSITSTAVFSAMIGCAWYFYPKVRKRYLLLGVSPFILWLCIYKQSWTIKLLSSWREIDRIQWWIAAVKQTCGHWLGVIFGMGPSAPWGGAFPIHNEWITVFHHFGLVGALITLGYILTLKRTNRMAYAAFLIACFNAMGTYPFHLAPTAMLTLIILGIMERERRAN